MDEFTLDRQYTTAVISLGCKVNRYESDSMKKILSDNGFVIVEPSDIADVYIINTCSVTNIAEKKSRQMLRRAKRRNPESIVVATGCYVNADYSKINNEEYVDILVGNDRKTNIAKVIRNYIAGRDGLSEQDSYIDISKTRKYEEMGGIDSVYLDHKRAYIKISDGCNQFCSYCLIPYTRGRVRSRAHENIVSEINELALSGVKEFVLTGIHISSYGTDTESQQRYMLEDLIDDISALDVVHRIRLGSLEPGIITDAFLERISSNSKLCPHFHLSLQSACNSTLQRMNRKYTIEEYIKKCDMIREYYDRPSITTDIIVGFPGETDEEFDITKDNLERIEFSDMHIFKYSVRSGTMAEKMPGHVDEEKKNERSDILLKSADIYKSRYIDSLKGIEDEVLVEERCHDSEYFTGYTKRYVKIKLKGDSDIINNIVPYMY